MMYLTTGTNGAGKTVITLWDVRQAQVAQGRPVFFRGFTPKQQLKDWGWQEFDPEKWQDLPDGSICLIDEAQEVFGTDIGRDPPKWVADIAKYRRKRGFDFWLVCPHPSMLHKFVRNLIEKPSWHRHMKRTFGGEMVSELKFGYVEMACEKPASGRSAQVSMVPYHKEVYEWYESATLHTVKKKLPRAFWVAALAFPLALAAGGWAVYYMTQMGSRTAEAIKPGAGKLATASAGQPAGGQPGPGSTSSSASASDRAPLTPLQYAEMRAPRFEGLPHTAAAYDQVTQPSIAPYPAACVQSARSCSCWTQQGTRLQTPLQVCQQVVANGFFVDWQQGRDGDRAGAGRSIDKAAGSEPAPAPAPALVGRGESVPNWSTQLLSAPGETAPVFFPAATDRPVPAGPSTSRDGAVLASMRDGAWHKR